MDRQLKIRVGWLIAIVLFAGIYVFYPNYWLLLGVVAGFVGMEVFGRKKNKSL